MNLQDKILNKLNEIKIDTFTITDIIELDSYDNLRKSLERMVKNNKIRRIFRGVYDVPKLNQTFNMLYPPSIDGITKALARNFNWDIYPTGNYALNLLGVSTQVPSKYIYISSGPYKKYEYEQTVIEFKHGSLKITKQYSYNTNLVIQALKELGKENVTNDILRKIGDNFTLEELSKICTEAKNTTIWIYQYILKIKEIKDAKNS